jgi:phage terminase small subunit
MADRDTPLPATESLTARERRFVEELPASGWNFSKAARRAGASEGNARKASWRIRQRPAVKAAIDAFLVECEDDARTK